MAINGLTLNDSDWMKSIEDGYYAYFDQLYAQLNDEVEEQEETYVEPLSGEPFCGCHICNLRETIAYLAPFIIRGYKEKKIELED